MTKIFLLTSVVFIPHLFAFSQDIIFKKSGEEISAKVIEIGTMKTKYRKGTDDSKPVIVVDNSDLFFIKFSDGTKHVYETRNAQTESESLLGEFFEGGVVFHVDESAEHGLVAAEKDVPGLFRWGRAQRRIGANSFVDGDYNTEIIDAEYGYESAAGQCAALVSGGYDDWYLPAIDELELLYRNRSFVSGLDAIGRTKNRFDYVSSTEYKNRNDCWAIHFSRSGKHFYYNKRNEYSVRCIRKF